MMYEKRSMIVFFLLCSPVLSFAPSSMNSFRVPTSLYYVDPPHIGLDDTPSAHPKDSKKITSCTSKKYKLNSNRISELTRSSAANDVVAAIKRSQNLKDTEDIRVIGEFLLKEVDDSFAYGYKGSLLSRYAVAALRLEEHDLAMKAIRMRKERFSSSMTPFESSAILKGLLRLGKVSAAFKLLEDELSIEAGNKDRLKYRALSLSSIVSRYFFENKPKVALQACKMLAEMGPVVKDSGLQAEDLDMPWHRILAGADQCKLENPGSSYDSIVLGAMLEFPLDPNFQEEFNRVALKNDS